MDRTRRRVRKLVVVGAALGILGAAIPTAHSQLSSGDPGDLVTASVTGVLTMTAPGDIAFGSLSLTGANTQTGTLGVTSNVPYTVTLSSDTDKLTVHDGTAYTTQKLISDLAISPAATAGVGVGVATTSTATATAAQTVATSLGLSDDSYTVTYSQPATIADEPGDYQMNLTYTATEVL